jgi:hypothetical protein
VSGHAASGRVTRAVAVLAGLAAFAAGGAMAQAVPRVAPLFAPGRHVRVTAPGLGLRRAAGVVAVVRERDLILRTDGTDPAWARGGLRQDSLGVVVPLDSIRGLEVGVGTRRHFGAGFLVGGTILGAAGAISAAGCQGLICFSPAAVGAAGFLAGGLLGGLVGLAVETTDWATVPVGGQRIGLVVAPGGGVGVGASVTF